MCYPQATVAVCGQGYFCLSSGGDSFPTVPSIVNILPFTTSPVVDILTLELLMSGYNSTKRVEHLHATICKHMSEFSLDFVSYLQCFYFLIILRSMVFS
ncbi:hypothetical protein AB205_0152520 [Aquarana catesbeiana]|uniref:Uncharacterized protein n=1 Tax=Aquarana catesbeiana TaxID=8400 RepID=A0A2G9RDG3_AQUCT|nr:hypothetical protein AB205_0152520 [Aquarana catesbeiana]